VTRLTLLVWLAVGGTACQGRSRVRPQPPTPVLTAPVATAETARAECDRLVPVLARVTPATEGAHWFEHAVADSLLRRLKEDGEDTRREEEEVFMMLKEPELDPQEAVYLTFRRGPAPRLHRIVHARARSNLFDLVFETHFTEALVDQEFAEAVGRVWGEMTIRARWLPIETWRIPERRYTFETVGPPRTQGLARDPAPGTCAGALVEIGELLAEYADTSDDGARQGLRRQIMDASKTLLERLRYTER